MDFYSAYQKEPAEYDAHFTKQYDEDPNTSLIPVSTPPPTLLAMLDLEQEAVLFLAVYSAFVIDLQGKLKPNPVDTSTAYLEAILYMLQNPGLTGGGTVSPTWTTLTDFFPPSPAEATFSTGSVSSPWHIGATGFSQYSCQDCICPRDPKSSSLLFATKVHYFARISVNPDPGELASQRHGKLCLGT